MDVNLNDDTCKLLRRGDSGEFPLVSVIVPVYNAESYIERTLDSVLSQTMVDFELLLINDGSADGSSEICDEYGKKSTKIRVFHRSNQGVSAARNFGLLSARGRWVVFIDSDDWVSANYLDGLLQGAEMASGTRTVLVLEGLTNVFPNRTEIVRFRKERFVSEESVRAAYFSRQLYHFGYVCSKLFNLELIREREILFNPTVSHAEDLLFLQRYLLYTTELIFLPAADYFYRRETVGSLSKRFSPWVKEKIFFDSYLDLTSQLAKGVVDSKERDVALQLLFRLIYSLYRVKPREKMGDRLALLKEFVYSYKEILFFHKGVSGLGYFLLKKNSFFLFDFIYSILFCLRNTLFRNMWPVVKKLRINR